MSAERFQLEIQLAASLQHPHIVPLLTAGEAGGNLYYTMPYVAGESLRARLSREGELPIPAALRILSDITRALAYAHRHGIVHRDIKPENVLLAEGEAQVADFGIAKALSASSEAGALTSAGLALGTPVYMAPEQAMADPTTDHRADLYALAVVGYEMLTGQPPFSGRTPQHLIAAHATETPVPLEQRRPNVPAGLSRLIMRLLHKRPSDRPQTADEVLAALESARTYALLLETQVAATQRQPAAGDLLRQLDSVLADPVSITWASYGNLIAARLHEERGEIPAALAALRRRYIGIATFPHYVRYLREEGRLAALTGDRRGAIRAYRHYLALRSEAEPAVQPEVRAVKAELEAIERESTDRKRLRSEEQ